MFYVVFCVAVLSRLLPHPPNVACIAALGLLGGCYLRGWSAWVLPLAAMFISDVAGHVLGLPGMGFYNPLAMGLVYAGLAASVLLGRQLRGRPGALGVAAASLSASTTFFLVSNFGVWLTGAYSTTPAGLIACYTAAVPFYGLTIMGDLLFCGLLFTAFEAMRHALPGRLLGPGVLVPANR